MRIKMIIAFLVLLLALITMGYSGIKLAESRQVYQESRTAYKDIIEKVREAADYSSSREVSEISEASEVSGTNGTKPDEKKIYIFRQCKFCTL
jgi:hypothetical protein